MRERPILFSSPMVRAILAGAKTQTRRIVKNAHMMTVDGELVPIAALCPYGQPGDRLWVREEWRVGAWDEIAGCVAIDYKADGYCRREWLRVDDEDLFIRLRQQCIDDARAALGPADRYTWEPGRAPCRWRPSIHMPRWASRITLEITDVRVQRVQDISEADAVADGVRPGDGKWHALGDGEAVFLDEFGWFAPERYTRHNAPRHAFREAWEIINGPESWAANPWVWVIEFEKLEQQEQA